MYPHGNTVCMCSSRKERKATQTNNAYTRPLNILLIMYIYMRMCLCVCTCVYVYIHNMCNVHVCTWVHCRYEKRQAQKTRFEIEQKLRRERKAKKKKTREMAAREQNRMIRSSRRSRLEDSSKSKAMDELKAKRSAGKRVIYVYMYINPSNGVLYVLYNTLYIVHYSIPSIFWPSYSTH